MPASRSVPAALSVLSQTPMIIFAVTATPSAIFQILPVAASVSVLVSETAWFHPGCLPVVVLVDGSLLIVCP